MTDPPYGAVVLVAGAIRYALGVCASLTPGEMSRPTPCTQWDLGTLLAHLSESMADLEAGLRTGQLGLAPADPRDPIEPPQTAPGDPVEILRDRAAELLCATYCSGTPGQFVTVGALPVPAGVVACTGAVEIAVHGWDVAAARGCYCPIPASLATRLLGLCPLLIAGREGLFAVPVEVPGQASPGDKLVGFLGRPPEHPRPAERWLLTSRISASSLPDGAKGG
jgi:uncharacterized protein (TIGR03086 family)